MSEPNDDSPMPFGKYKGVLMQDVPCSYLHWYYHANANHNIDTEVGKYILKNISSIKMEDKDLIWN